MFKIKNPIVAFIAKVVAWIAGIDAVWDFLGKVALYVSPVSGSHSASISTSITTFTQYVTTTINFYTTTTTAARNADALSPFTGTATNVSLNGVGVTFTPLAYGPALILMVACILIWTVSK